MAQKQQLEFEATVSANRLNKLFDDLRTGGEAAARDLNTALGGTVKKTILFETKADETGARKLVAVERERLTAVDRLSREQQKLNNIQRGSVTSLRQQVNEAKQARDQIAKYETSVGTLGGQVRSLNSEWVRNNQQVARLSRELDVASASGFWQRVKSDLNLGGLTNFSSNLVAITQGFQAASIVAGQFLAGVNQVVSTAAELQQFALTFKAINQGAAGGADALSRASKIAIGLGVNLNTVEESFRQLSPVVLNVGGTIQDVDNITGALSSRFAAFGISGDKARRVMNGVIQAFAKGKLQAEELTQQISEADPAFKTDLARAVGATTAELEQMVKAGELTSEKLITLIPLLSKSTLLFGKLGPTAATAVNALERGSVTIDQVRANLQTLNTLSLRNLAKAAEPVISAFFGVQAVITDFFTRISDSASIQTLANIFAKIVQTLGRVIDSFLILTEGALKVLDAISPLVNAILQIPGAVELAGLAILGKFVKPLKSIQGLTGPVLQSQQAIVNGIRRIWAGSSQPIEEAKQGIQDFQRSLKKPLSSGQLGDASGSLRKLSSNAQAAANDVTAVATTAGQSIDKQASRLNSKISQLRKQLTALEGAPTAKPSAAKNELATQEAKAAGLRKQLAALRQEASQIKPSGIAGLAGEASEFGEKFQRVSTRLDAANLQVNEFGRNLASASGSAEASLGRGTLVIRELRDEAGKPIFGRTFRIDPQFLADVQRLAATDPSRATRLLQLSLKGLQVESKDAARSLAGADTQAKKLFAASIQQGAKEIKDAITGIGQSAKALNVGRFIELDREQVSVRQSLEQTENTIKRLRGELETSAKDNLSKATEKQQRKIREELERTLQKRRTLFAQQEELAQRRISSRRQAVGFDPTELNRSAANLESYISIVRKSELQERLASNSRIQELKKGSNEARTALDDLSKKYQDVAQQSAKFGIKINPGELFSQRDLKIADAYRAVIAGNAQELARVENQIRSTIAAETNFNGVLNRASDAAATKQERIKALSLISKVYGAAIQDNNNKIQAFRSEITNLKTAQRELAKQQISRAFDPDIAAETARKSADLSAQIRVLEDSIGDLQDRNRGLSDSNKAVNTSLVAVGKEAGVAGRLLRGTGGLLAAPFKAAGGLIASTGSAITGLVAALGPLQVVLIAIGTVSRLYADGNREAAEASKKFKDQTELLKLALNDINPSVKTAAQSSTALSRTWDALAVATVAVVDRIRGAFEGVAVALEGLVRQIQISLGPVEQFLAKLTLLAGAAALGGKLGAVFGPWGIAVGAALGLATGAIVGTSLAADAASVQLAKFAKKSNEVLAAAQAQTPVIAQLGEELQKLIVPGKGIKAENLVKFGNGLKQVNQSIELQKGALKELEGGLAAGENKYAGNIEKLKKLRIELQKAGEERERLSKKNTREFEAYQALGGDPSGFVQTPGLQEAANKVNKLRDELEALEKQTIEVGTANNKTADKISVLKGEIDKSTAIADELAAASGRVTSKQQNLLNSTGKLGEAIKQLNESASSFDLKTDDGRKGFDDTINRAQDLQRILDFIGKTKYQIKIETKKLDESILDAQLRIDLDPGPVREISQLANKVNTELEIAGLEFTKTANAWKQSVKEGSASQATASEGIENAAREYLVKTRDGSANILDAARGFREQLNDAVFSLRNLKLSNPDFFTTSELRANAREIEDSFRAALEKVRRETGDSSFFPRLEGKTSSEILAAKQRFTEVRGEADKLTEKIGEISGALNIAVGLLAKIANVELEDLKGGGVEIKDLMDEINGKTKEVAGSASTIGEVFGTISANGQEYVLFMDKATGQTETLTRAQFEARKASEIMAEKAAKAGKKTAEAGNQAAEGGKRAGSAAKIAGDEAQKAGDKGAAAVEKVGKASSRIGQVLGTISGGGQQYVIFWDTILQTSRVLTKEAFNRLKADEASSKAIGRQADQMSRIRMGLPDILGPGDSYASGAKASIFLPAGTMDAVRVEARNLGKEVGGDFTSALMEMSNRNLISPLFDPTSYLFNAKQAVFDYKAAIDELAIAKANASDKEAAYALAVSANMGGVEQAAQSVKAAYDQVAIAQTNLDSLESPYAKALQDLRDYNVEVSSIPLENGPLVTLGESAETLADSYKKAVDKAYSLSEANNSLRPVENLESDSKGFADNISSGTSALQSATTAAATTEGSLINAATAAGNIKSAIESLQGLDVNVNVNYLGSPPGRWMGGPVTGGSQYQVNELGQEGFLSASGRLSAINRPRNGLWRAPSSGTVIPADAWANMKIPSFNIRPNSPSSTGISNGNSLNRLARVIQSGLARNANSGNSGELATIQAHQAAQIGKLTHAVDKLAGKNWNVAVNVRGSGQSSYLQAVNRMS